MSITRSERADVSPTFSARDLDDEQHKLLTQLQQDYSLIEARLNGLPDGRYKAMALTELEKSAMMSVKAVSRMRDGK